MTTNRLAKSNNVPALAVPSDPKERERFWIERGNRLLWGYEPLSNGKYLNRTDLQWAAKDGHYWIEPRKA